MVMNGSRKKVAVPLFGDRVSPHFGSSSKFLVLVTEKDAILDQSVFELKEADPMQQARQLVSLGVEKVVCGGIQRRFKDWLTGKGVAVLDNQRGRAEEVVEALLDKP